MDIRRVERLAHGHLAVGWARTGVPCRAALLLWRGHLAGWQWLPPWRLLRRAANRRQSARLLGPLERINLPVADL